MYDVRYEWWGTYPFSSQSPSPQRHPTVHGIVDSVLAVFESVVLSCELNDYLEHVAPYFGFGLSPRVVVETPFLIRLYSGFTASDHEELTRVLSALPKDRRVTLDLSNYEYDSARSLPPQLQQLVSRTAGVKWIVSPEWAGILRRFGADHANIHIVEGPDCPLQRTRFTRR